MSGVTTLFSYSAENRLTALTGGVTSSYVYDGDGKRVKEISGISTTTVYVGNYFEWTGSTTSMKRYYYAGGTRVAMRTGSSTLNYLLSDHLGSQALTLTSTGARLNTNTELRYMPYGAIRYTAGTTPTTFNFTGQRKDSGSGLLFYNARWYDPLVGRFLQADTLVPSPGNPSHRDFLRSQSLNRYSYVGNSPVCGTDPDGHCWPVCTALIGGAIGAGIGAASVALPQMIRNVRDDQPLTTNIDPAEVGKAAAVGFVSGAISGATAGVGTGIAATIGVGAISNVIAGQAAIATNNALSGRAITTGMGDMGGMARDALLGGATGALSYGVQQAFEHGTAAILARRATHNNAADTVILGGHPNYRNIGEKGGLTYFELGTATYGWAEKKGIGWLTNQKFMESQAAQGKTFIVTHSADLSRVRPFGKGTSKEIQWLSQRPDYRSGGGGYVWEKME